MQIIKLYSTGITTANAVASAKLAGRGRIIGVLFSGSITQGAGGGGRSAWELSVSSVSQITSNDPTGTLGTFTVGSAASSTQNQSVYIQLPLVPVEAGQTLYLHCLGDANLSAATITVTIMVS